MNKSDQELYRYFVHVMLNRHQQKSELERLQRKLRVLS